MNREFVPQPPRHAWANLTVRVIKGCTLAAAYVLAIALCFAAVWMYGMR